MPGCKRPVLRQRRLVLQHLCSSGFPSGEAAYDDAYTEAGVYEKYPADYLNKLITLTTDENTVLLLHKTDLTNLISEMISNSIMHGVSDAEWDAFQTNLQDAGIEEYVQTYQAALDRFLAE